MSPATSIAGARRIKRTGPNHILAKARQYWQDKTSEQYITNVLDEPKTFSIALYMIR